MTDDRFLVDVNVFIDIIERRHNWEYSLATIDTVERNYTGFISALTKMIIYFRRARIRGDVLARKEIGQIFTHFGVVSLDSAVLDESFSDESFNDVEDAVQFHSALKVANVLVTRNVKDYKAIAGRITVLTPEAFLEKYGSEEAEKQTS
jgi:hypothetical protein